MSADSVSTADCVLCGTVLPARPAPRSAAEWIVVVCFATLHMGAFIGDGLGPDACGRCRRRKLLWALPAALALSAAMLTGAGLLLRTATFGG